jgi:nucleotide-binding universal stress UspA family protein
MTDEGLPTTAPHPEENTMSTSTIVVGVDGSASSVAAVRWAAREAALTGATLHAVTSWTYPASYGWAPVIEDLDWAENARTVLDQALKEAFGGADSAAVVRHVAEGHPAQVLLDAADGADLLVVGSRGHGGFTGMLLGSVSQFVVSHARCPVVVTREDTQDALDPA